MNMLMSGLKVTAGMLGQAVKETGHKGKLQAELLLVNREIENRKRTFGEELYEYVEPLSKSQDFFCANDKMTDVIRGPLLAAQREISALDIKRGKTLKEVQKNTDAEKGAYKVAENIGETLQNTAKKAGFVSNHAKLKTELSMVEAQIKDHKQQFGLEMFQVLVDLEDIDGWLPTVRDIRSIYDQARRDIEKIDARRKEKEKELCKLGGVPMTTSSEASRKSNADADEDDGPPSYFKQAAAAQNSNDEYSAPPVSATPAPVADPLFGNVPVPASRAPHDPFAPTVNQSYGAQADATMNSFGTVNTSGVTFGSVGSTNAAMGDSSARSSGGFGQAAPTAATMNSFGTVNSSAAAFGSLTSNNAPMGDSSARTSGGFENATEAGSTFAQSAPMGTGGTFSQSAPMGNADPFAPMGSPAANVPQFNDPFAAQPPVPSNPDPFAAFDNLAEQQPQDNPLFRY